MATFAPDGLPGRLPDSGGLEISKAMFQNANYPSADTTATDCTFTFNRIESSKSDPPPL